MKRSLIAVVAVFLAWSVLDFVIHGVILGASYADTASLWRPMNEMKMSVMYISVLIASIAFVLIYSLLISKEGISTGVKFGLLFGLAAGMSMGFGSYSVMPIPLTMAFAWFLGAVMEGAVGGFIIGWIIRE
jgi:hypothetical protein